MSVNTTVQIMGSLLLALYPVLSVFQCACCGGVDTHGVDTDKAHETACSCCCDGHELVDECCEDIARDTDNPYLLSKSFCCDGACSVCGVNANLFLSIGRQSYGAIHRTHGLVADAVVINSDKALDVKKLDSYPSYIAYETPLHLMHCVFRC